MLNLKPPRHTPTLPTPAVRRVGARFYAPSAGSTGANSSKLTRQDFEVLLVFALVSFSHQRTNLLLGLPVIEQSNNKHTRRDCQEIE